MAEPVGSRSRHVNFALVLALLVISACLAKFFLHPPAARETGVASLKSDLKNSLDSFWNTTQSQVELSQARPPEVEAKVRVAVPVGTGLRQRLWTFPLIQFVASRHSDLRLSRLQVVDAASGTPFQPDDHVVTGMGHWVVATGPPAQAQESSGKAVGNSNAFADLGYFEEAKSELLRRNGQAVLDKQLGAGCVLLLVDVTASQPGAVPLPNRNDPSAGAPRFEGGLAQPAAAVMGGNEVAKIEAVLVFNGDFPGNDSVDLFQKAVDIVQSTLGWNEDRGDRLRHLVLPELRALQ